MSGFDRTGLSVWFISWIGLDYDQWLVDCVGLDRFNAIHFLLWVKQIWQLFEVFEIYLIDLEWVGHKMTWPRMNDIKNPRYVNCKCYWECRILEFSKHSLIHCDRDAITNFFGDRLTWPHQVTWPETTWCWIFHKACGKDVGTLWKNGDVQRRCLLSKKFVLFQDHRMGRTWPRAICCLIADAPHYSLAAYFCWGQVPRIPRVQQPPSAQDEPTQRRRVRSGGRARGSGNPADSRHRLTPVRSVSRVRVFPTVRHHADWSPAFDPGYKNDWRQSARRGRASRGGARLGEAVRRRPHLSSL